MYLKWEKPAMAIPLIEEIPAVQDETPLAPQHDFVETAQQVEVQAVPPVENSRPVIYDIIIGVMVSLFCRGGGHGHSIQ